MAKKSQPDRTLVADGFEAAFIGWFTRCGQPTVAVYDMKRCVKILMKRDKMTREEAEEYIDFNVTGAWLGKGTPAFIERGTLGELHEICTDSTFLASDGVRGDCDSSTGQLRLFQLE
jgi:hypothetical protein